MKLEDFDDPIISGTPSPEIQEEVKEDIVSQDYLKAIYEVLSAGQEEPEEIIEVNSVNILQTDLNDLDILQFSFLFFILVFFGFLLFRRDNL